MEREGFDFSHELAAESNRLSFRLSATAPDLEDPDVDAPEI